MATIKDVARLAGVSVATVSRVINNSPKASDASRQAVQSAMETLNYHPTPTPARWPSSPRKPSVWWWAMSPTPFSAPW
jgi:DNA-binding LacI/PurR family transcriptional regulator